MNKRCSVICETQKLFTFHINHMHAHPYNAQRKLYIILNSRTVEHSSILYYDQQKKNLEMMKLFYITSKRKAHTEWRFVPKREKEEESSLKWIVFCAEIARAIQTFVNLSFIEVCAEYIHMNPNLIANNKIILFAMNIEHTLRHKHTYAFSKS